MKKSRLLLIILSAIIFATGFALFRPDVEIALWVISHASDLPEGDVRVALAAEYLIWAGDARIYNRLRTHLWACDMAKEWEDYRGEITA